MGGLCPLLAKARLNSGIKARAGPARQQQLTLTPGPGEELVQAQRGVGAHGRGEGASRAGRAQRKRRHTHIHARQPRQPSLSWFPRLPGSPFRSLWGKGRGVRKVQWGALASPRNCVFQSGHHPQRKRGLSPRGPALSVGCGPDPAGVTCQPFTGPRRASRSSGPLLAHICRTCTWARQPLWPRADCGASIPGPTRLCEDSLGDLWPATPRGCIPRLSRHWPKESFKARTSQSLADSDTHPPSHPFLAQPCSLTQGPVWWEGVSMTPLF